jgi:hypothetical protein
MKLNQLSHQSRLKNANKPKPMMIKPEILFSHCNLLKLDNPRNIPVKPLRIIHHIAEPKKTPKTKIPAET